MKTLTIILTSVSMLAMSGCAITTAGVKKGDERNMARSINDVSAGRVISARLSRAYDFDLDKVDIEVAEGIAVLTGSVPTDKDRIEAERIAWSGPNIVQVGNELRVGDAQGGLVSGGKDALLSSTIRTRMIAEKNVKARNVNIETYNGTVYLLGVARDTAELERMTYIASTTKGAKEVISYVKIASQPVTSQAGYSMPSASMPMSTITSPYGGNVPQLQAPSQPAPQTALRQLPDFLTTTPNGVPQGAPAGDPNEPFFRDPATGERIILPPGTKTIPYVPGKPTDPSLPKVGDAPYYINPSNGQKVEIVWTGN